MFPFDDAKVRRNSITAMDLDTKNTKNSIILDGNQETVCVHSAIFGVLLLVLLFNPCTFLGLPDDYIVVITEVLAEVDIEDQGTVGRNAGLCYAFIA